MLLNSISDCTEEQFKVILENKNGNASKSEREFYYGLLCIKDTIKEISEGPFKVILPYIEYPLNLLIKNVDLNQEDEIYFKEKCEELDNLYARLLVTHLMAAEELGTRKQKKLARKIIKTINKK